jgi:succinyl-CoA synthetase beta subunit
MADGQVKAVLVNIFGGIMKCDVIAEGIVAAAREIKVDRPLVVRLEGTNVQQGRKILEESGLSLTSANSLSDAAKLAVAAVQGTGGRS